MIIIAPCGRHWAVYAGEELVCVCLYKKGAHEVKQRLEAVDPEARSEANRPAPQPGFITPNRKERKLS